MNKIKLKYPRTICGPLPLYLLPIKVVEGEAWDYELVVDQKQLTYGHKTGKKNYEECDIVRIRNYSPVSEAYRSLKTKTYKLNDKEGLFADVHDLARNSVWYAKLFEEGWDEETEGFIKIN